MFIFYLTFVQVYCQLQLNPISGQNFFYRIQDVFNTTGYTLQVLQNLGFQIQGGFISGNLNQSINTQNVISTSQFQKMNLIGLLEFNTQYSVSILVYNLLGQINSQTYLFNVSTTNQTCQNFEIIGYVNVILHCINTSNSQITLYYYNNTQLVTVNTGYIISNVSQLQSTNIQYYYGYGSYDLYFIYISQFQSFVLYTNLYNNTFTQLEQIWSQPAQFIQIFVSFEQEVFALQFNSLNFYGDNYRSKFRSQNGSNWISMNILYDEYDEFLILLVNNYTIYELYFEFQFYIFSQQQLAVTIEQAQLFSDVDYIFILTPNQTLVYQYEGDMFSFYQYSQYSIYNQLNQYSSLSNLIINTNSTGIQFFQLLDYYLYNNNPSQSGFITIGMFNLNNQMMQNESIYINVLSSFQNQICPYFVNFNGESYISYNSYYQEVQLSDYYIGSNLTYSINQTTLNGTSILNQLSYELLTGSTITFAAVYSISQLNSLLIVSILENDVYFQIEQYSIVYQNVLVIIYQKIKLSVSCQDIYFSQYDNGTIMSFVASYNYIYAFEIVPTVGVIQYYTINLTDTLNSSDLFVQSVVTINNLLLILTSTQQIVQIQYFTSYYIIQDCIKSDYNQLVGYQYEQFFIFGLKTLNNANYVDIYVWEQDQIQLFETLQLSFITNTEYDVWITPVTNGIFISYEKSQIRFYDKSSFTQNNIGSQTFYYQVDTTNITFITQCQSDQFLYFLVKQNDGYYINIYQGTQIINSLYKSIYINATESQITAMILTATTDIINHCDYLSFYSGKAYVYQIPHIITYQQLPNSLYTIQYGINNTLNVSNLNNSQQFYVNFTILQQNIQITQVQELTAITNNQTSGSLSINPYQYFSGVIQSYNVSCGQCQNLSFNSILTNNYIFYNYSSYFSASYIENDTQYLYNLNDDNLFLLTYNISQQLSQQDMTKNITNLATLPSLNQPLLVFVEVQTNSVTWLINNRSILYINTILNGSSNQINMTVPGINSSNEALFAIYNDGILQILTQYSYYCYYFYIENQTMQLVSILDNIYVADFSVQDAVSFIDVYNSENNYVFGIYYLNLYSMLRMILLDVQLYSNGSFKVNGYNSFPLEEIVSFQKDFQFQYVIQYGQPYIVNYTSFVHLAYTSLLGAGILELQFEGINLIQFQQVCNIFMINSTFNNNYLNLLSLYDNQLAIMNYAQNDANSNLTLQLYLIDLNQCYDVQPYSFQIIGTFSSLDDGYDFQLNYLNSNELLLSLSDQTYVVEVNQLLQITYQTQVNSTITLTAQNPYYSLNQSIQVSFSPQIIPNNSNNSNNTNNTNTTSHHLQWYWILLITIGSLLVIGLIILLLYFKLKKGDDSNYQQFSGRNEIEIKSQNRNITGL